MRTGIATQTLKAGRSVLRVVNSNDVIFYFYGAAGIYAVGFFAQLLEGGILGAAVEPARVVNQQDVTSNRVLVDCVEFLLHRGGDVEVMAVEPEQAGFFEGRQ